MLCHYSTVVTPLSTKSAHHPCRSRAARDGLRGKVPRPRRPRRRIAAKRLASAPHGQGRRHRCGHDRRARPRRRRAGPGGRRGLPRADPALPPPRLGRARPRRDLGRPCGPPWPRSALAWPTAGDTVAAIGITNQRETLVAFDRSTGQPLHRAIVWQDRRTAALCAELDGGRPPAAGARHDRPGPRPLLQRHQGGLAAALGRSRARRRRPEALLLHRRHLGPVEPDRWRAGGVYATDPSNASRTLLLDTATLAWSAELCDLFGVPLHTLPEVRPSAGRFGTAALGDLGPASGVLDGVPVSGVLGDQQAALFGQACFEPGMVKVTYGTGSFALANAGPERPPAPDGLTVSCAWDLGEHADGTHARVAYALEGSTFVSGAAIQWLRDGLGIISSVEEVGPLAASVPDSGGVTFVPGPHRPRQPVVGSAGPRHRDRPHPRRRTRAAGAGLRRGDGVPGARHDRCHGRRLGPPPVRAAGRRGCRRHGPPPPAAGRAEPHARRPAALARVDRAGRGHGGRAGRGRVVVAGRAGRAVGSQTAPSSRSCRPSWSTRCTPAGAAPSRSRWDGRRPSLPRPPGRVASRCSRSCHYRTTGRADRMGEDQRRRGRWPALAPPECWESNVVTSPFASAGPRPRVPSQPDQEPLAAAVAGLTVVGRDPRDLRRDRHRRRPRRRHGA